MRWLGFGGAADEIADDTDARLNGLRSWH